MIGFVMLVMEFGGFLLAVNKGVKWLLRWMLKDLSRLFVGVLWLLHGLP